MRNSLQRLNHDNELLKLETTIQNCKGHARASAQGLRAIMETLVYGSHFMLFEEASHIYSSFFETHIDEEAFRDLLLHPETDLNALIVTHPITIERFVVMNKNTFCDISMFCLIILLKHFHQKMKVRII